MTSIAKRQKLHQYIDGANSHDIDELLKYVEKGMEPDVPYDKWDDPEFVSEMERHAAALENGTDKGRTWEEVKERARQVIKPNAGKRIMMC